MRLSKDIYIKVEERTLVIIKPDGIQRHLAGRIIDRFEKKGFKLVAAKFAKISQAIAKKHYAVHKNKPFFENLTKYLASSPVLIMVWQAKGVIEMTRKMLGATFGIQADPGTIRGDFSCSKGYNLVHGSDSPVSAEMEIKLFFDSQEIIDYDFTDEQWLYGKND